MKVLIKSLLIFVVLTSCNSLREKENASTADLAIQNVTLIDGTGKAARSNVSILVKDQRIFKILDETVNFLADTVIDGRGKYVIPGLFDNHVHIGYDETKFARTMSQLIHFGVTTILVPGADNSKLLTFKSEVAEKGLTAPKIYHTSLMTTVEGRHPIKTYGSDLYREGENINIIRNEEEIGQIVEQALRDKAIAVKVMIEDGPAPPFVERIPENYVSRLSKRAHEAGLDFFAHVSDMQEVKIAVSNNVDALMHFAGVEINWHADSAVIDKILSDSISWVTTMMLFKSFFYPINKQWTESKHYQVFEEDQTDYFSDRDKSLENEARAVLKGYAGSDQIPLETVMQPFMADIKKLYDMGINVVVGTDVRGRPYILPGLSVHEEMQLLAIGGFSPQQIIQCASLNAAKMLKIHKHYGSVEEGKYADMVLLNKNPLDDISNTLSINLVVKDGEIQERLSFQ